DQPVCYFIPDAHHAIPFTRLSNSPPYLYAPPSWFDARLESSDPMSDRPAKFFIWLNHGTIKYTIEPHYEDLWTITDRCNAVVNVHDRPQFGPNGTGNRCGGYGLPYYGLVTAIENTQTHDEMKYSYCTFGPALDCDPDVPANP